MPALFRTFKGRHYYEVNLSVKENTMRNRSKQQNKLTVSIVHTYYEKKTKLRIEFTH